MTPAELADYYRALIRSLADQLDDDGQATLLEALRVARELAREDHDGERSREVEARELARRLL